MGYQILTHEFEVPLPPLSRHRSKTSKHKFVTRIQN